MKKVRRFFKILGPGLVTGAADDDPSGIVTYTIAGAKSGNALLWTAIVSWPLMAGVQLLCARVALVTGRGLAANFKDRYPKPLMLLACLALVAANTINIGADLAGMADAMSVLTGLRSFAYIAIFAGVIGGATVLFSYRRIERILKWLCLVLLAYPIVAFISKPDWWEVLRHALIPQWPSGHEAWADLVAILGTTISPYLFFWQAAQEVEEEQAVTRKTSLGREQRLKKIWPRRKIDVLFGTFSSNVVMFFIIVTASATLHRHGVTNIQSSREAAEALGPLAGRYAMALYAAGIVGVGLLAIPTLAGASAYAFAETLQWRQGLNLSFPQGVWFYTVIIGSIAAGALMSLAPVNPMKALLWSAIINGLLAPFLLLGLLFIVKDKKVVDGSAGTMPSFAATAVATVVMFGAAIGMFVF